jgi:hypothetical protein
MNAAMTLLRTVRAFCEMEINRQLLCNSFGALSFLVPLIRTAFLFMVPLLKGFVVI